MQATRVAVVGGGLGGRRRRLETSMRVELGEDGRITQVHLVLTDRKLSGLRLPSPA